VTKTMEERTALEEMRDKLLTHLENLREELATAERMLATVTEELEARS